MIDDTRVQAETQKMAPDGFFFTPAGFTVQVTTTLNEVYSLGVRYSSREDAQKMARYIRLEGWEQGRRASIKEVQVI